MKIKLFAIAVLICSLAACNQKTESLFQAADNPIASFSVNDRDPVAMIKKVNQKYAERDSALINYKYQEMKASRFAFYRATAYIFYSDIMKDKSLEVPFKILVQGDPHLENMGTYLAGNHFAYDLNDFDDAFGAMYTWELARCAVSIQLTAADAGLTEEAGNRLVKSFVEKYLQNLEKISDSPASLNTPLTTTYLTKFAAKAIEKVTKTNHQEFINEYAPNGKFVFNDKVRPVSDILKNKVIQALSSRKVPGFTAIKDVAARVAGMASLGRYRYLALLEGSSKNNNDDLILELKEASEPAGSIPLGPLNINHADRVVKAYSYFLPEFSTYLGITQIDGIDFFIRDFLQNEKVSLSKLKTEADFLTHLETVALVIARSHARSGKIKEILADTKKKNNLLEQIVSFSDSYFTQVNKDYQQFKSQI